MPRPFVFVFDGFSLSEVLILQHGSKGEEILEVAGGFGGDASSATKNLPTALIQHV